MAVYAYRARDAIDRITSGTLVADSGAEARQRLRDQGLAIERFKLARAERTNTRSFNLFGARRREHIAEFARLFALLLKSGLPHTEAVDVLIAQSKGRWQVALRTVREKIETGASLADALSQHPKWFDALFIEAVRVGEHAGTLDEALVRLSSYLKEKQSLSTRLTTAAVYPLILMAVATGVVLFLMTYVIPQLLAVLTASGQELPTSSRMLKALSDGLIGYWFFILAGVGAVALTVALILRTTHGRRCWHATLLRAPLIGVLLRKTLVARFAQQMSMMLESGVPFVEAVRIVRKSARNVVLAGELNEVESAVESGRDIAAPLAGSRVFPPLVVRLVAVGQSSGELNEILAQLREGYETEVRVAVHRFTAALEPLLIIAMAAVVGFIVFATLMPILQATRGLA